MAALFELLSEDEKASFLGRMNALGLEGVSLEALRDEKCGIVGTRMQVSMSGEVEESHDADLSSPDHQHGLDHHHEAGHSHHHHEPAESNSQSQTITHSHDHSGMAEIEARIQGLPVSEKVASDVLAVYRLLAEAESLAHGKPVDQVHFHEVGMLDALADITGVSLLIEQIAPDQVIASAIHLGSGQVRTQHGILPVPAPATAQLLKGIPSYSGNIRGELCTPTGAALLKHFVGQFGGMPVMQVENIGYGMGKKDFPAANCLRAFLGESSDDPADVLEIVCNLDDMTPEAIGFAMERLMEAGALDVYTTAIGMKKSRPGTMLSCLCRPEDAEKFTRHIFENTSTLGLRMHRFKRATLARGERQAETPYGVVRIKTASGWGVSREKVEYEDAARLARLHNLPISIIQDELNHQGNHVP